MSGQKNSKQIFDVIVIGAGPAGMMAAGAAARGGNSVLLLEKNKRLGEKLRITGGGRCNVTNAEYDLKKLLKNYGTSEKFLYSAFSQFGVEDTFSFFESAGLPLIIEEGKRAFPHTHSAPDVERVMEEWCRQNNVTIQTQGPVERILTDKGSITGVVVKNKIYPCQNLIIATGGMSHPETGSTGDGFAWLRDLGHSIVSPTPSLVPIAIKDAWVKKISGTTLTDVKVSFISNGKKQFSKTGNILCTHFGFSGPLILNSAGQVADLLHSGAVTGIIDLYPHKDSAQLDKEMMSIFELSKNKLFKNMCKDLVPAGTVEAVLLLAPESLHEKKVHSISRDERRDLVTLLKALPFNVKGLMGYDRAVVADGGIPLTEIDMRTMRSKKYPNLYITGDLLHINRPSGGFSLQLCWTTGYVAGKSV